MLVNRGTWDELPEQCKGCFNLRARSVYMDGSAYYSCPKYLLHDKDEPCPERITGMINYEKFKEVFPEIPEHSGFDFWGDFWDEEYQEPENSE